ncbi:MAG: hypothetical protein D6710_10630 [Nitrospirae bacterium]|nr:MAG: hypothetical protein D6710_10630 [Nitrospirota bacterium]
MTRVRVNPGACGLISVIEVKRSGKNQFSLKISSDCEMVQRLSEELVELDWMDVFKRILDNPVYKKASSTLRHTSCPVPSAILKALEVEAQLAVKRDVTIEFLSEPEE